MKKITDGLYLIVPLLMLVVGFIVVVRAPTLVDNLRMGVFDAYQRLQPRVYTPLPVKIIDIDDASLEQFGQWPWPRTLLARLVDRLARGGVSVVGLDLILAEPDRTSPRQVLKIWPDSELLQPLRARLAELPDNEMILAHALAKVPSVGGFVLTNEVTEKRPTRLWDLQVQSGDPLAHVPKFKGAIVYLPELENALAGAGSYNLVSDADGLSRRLNLLFSLNAELYPSFAAEVLRLAQRADGYQVEAGSGSQGLGTAAGIASVKIGAFRIPTDGQGRIWLHYTRDEPSRYLSARRVLAENFDLASLKDHIVLIGTSAAGLKDLRATPLNPVTPGVELHADLIEQTLLGDFLYRPGWAEPAEFIYSLILAGVLLVLLRRLGAIGCAALGAVTTAVAFGFSWFAYLNWQWLVDPVLPSLMVLAMYLVASTLNYMKTEAERKQVRMAFSHYLAPAVVEQLVDNPGMLKLGGEKRETTFLFSDIANFTALTERLDPAVLVRILNDYLDGTCHIVFEHGGTIDKIVGDAMHVMFNAPSEQPDHAARAVRCALELDRYCQQFVARYRAEGLDVGITRIGVNSGETVVGNFGGTDRFDYTAHGDAINTAARLESVNKHLGTRICISETTRKSCNFVQFRPVAKLVLKGKSEALEVFEPLAGDADPDWLKAYLGAYRDLDVDAARAKAEFSNLHETYPWDPLSDFHLRRLQAGQSGSTIVMAQK